LLDRKGEIQWRNHGPVSDAAFQALTDRVHSILFKATQSSEPDEARSH
jgi:hypothetical protein